jgi:hypothetical protein
MTLRNVLSLLFLGAIAACSSNNSGGGGGTASFDCGVCNVVNFTCDASGAQLTVSVPDTTATGCSGTVVSPDGTDPFWIHCASGRVCAEHDDECWAASSTGTSFSYTVTGKNLNVTCNPS